MQGIPFGVIETPPHPWETLFPKQVKLFNIGIAAQAQLQHPNTPATILCSGPRKCVEIDTPVWTPTGMTLVQNLKEGDSVVGFMKDKLIRSFVTDLGERNSTDGIELTSTNGFSLRASTDHPVWCVTDQGDLDARWMTTSEIASLLGSGYRIWSPSTKPSEADPIPGVVRDIPECLESYWLGSMTGDGSCITKESRSIAFHNIDPECFGLVEKYATKYGSTMRLQKRSNCTRVFRKARSLKAILVEHGLSVKSDQKRIPKQIMEGTIRQMRSFLMGLFDTDGTASNHGTQVSIILSSAGLISDTYHLLARLGIFSVQSDKVMSCPTASGKFVGTYRMLTIYNPDAVRFGNEVGFAITRKRESLKAFGLTLHKGTKKYSIPFAICKHIKQLRSKTFTGIGKAPLGLPRNRAWHRARKFIQAACKYSPGPTIFSKLLSEFPEDSGLKSLNSASRWVEWKSAKAIQSRFWDISVENCESFIVAGIPQHNSVKSIALCHRVIRHLYETPAAHAVIIVKTTKSATDGGVWLDMIDIAMPVWIADRSLNFDYTTFDRDGNPGVKTDSKTRTLYFKVRNAFGGESTLRLFSIEHDHEVKQKLKSTRFSCIWISELSNFYEPTIYRDSWEQLRMFHLKRYEHLWVSDTNPSEEGEDSWIYRLFIRKNAELAIGKSSSVGAEEFKRAMVHMEFTLDDNLAMNETEKEIQAALYSDDPGEYARNFEGRWVKGHGNKGKHFSDIFSRAIHVIGGEEGDSGEIDVSPNTDTLYTGWDLGAATNHASGIMEKRIINVNGVELSSWSILESFKHIKEQIGIKVMAVNMLEKMRHLEELYGRKYDWTHYTDDTALTVWRPSSESFDYLEVMIATAGEIEMTGVPKPAGSVKARVNLVRRLLREKRLWVAGKCEDVIGMFENLKQGSTQADFIEWNEWKHTFDWISYVLFMECANELAMEASRPKARPADSVTYVSL